MLHHVVEGIHRFGPVYSTWMYSYERFNSWLSRRALNRFRPEATIMETYRVSYLLKCKWFFVQYKSMHVFLDVDF